MSLSSQVPAKKSLTNQELREISVVKIYNSALSLFVEQGYHATTVDQIAAGAGLTKGGVYFYFGKKEEIVSWIVDKVSREYIDEIGSRIERDYDRAQDRLVSLMRWQANYAKLNPREGMLLITVSLNFHNKTGALADQIVDVYQRLHALLVRVFEHGRRTGEFTPKVRTSELASFYIAAHDGMMLEWYRSRRPIEGPELVRAFRQTIMNGILRQSS
jgi:AcrR family transcriptional regulator